MFESEILHRHEVKAVLDSMKTRTSKNQLLDRIVFRLSAGCGLRVKGMCGLILADLNTDSEFPYILIRRDNTKGQIKHRKPRRVPLYWDTGTRLDIVNWLNKRRRDGAEPSDPFICQQRYDTYGKPLKERVAACRWRTAIQVLGESRLKELSIHTGRHTFCSHALAAGRSVIEVKNAVGHSSISTTEIYLHAVGRENVPDLYPENE
ncbi:tyrosine-type recombinase/integrase [Novipirellula sp.]|uniref:tyrosine-type recombinase/integrase n=1 Tax=Novipirellula sp. TaxID=2795430 RepID=UPI0035638F43